ncbi:MAG: type 4a pilus biogenesis protein PilO [Mycobacteriales bacterium]
MDARRQWVAITAALCVVVVAAGYFLLISPQKKKAAGLRTQVTAEQSTQQQLRAQIALLTSEGQNLSHEQALLAKAQGYLPLTPGLPSLIRQLTAATDNAGVDLVTLSPSTPTAASSGTSSGATASLYQIPLTLSLAGGYFEVENFLSNLENLPRALMVTGVNVSPQGGSSSTSASSGATQTAAPQVGKGELTVAITGRVFMTTTNLTGAASAAPAAGK